MAHFYGELQGSRGDDPLRSMLTVKQIVKLYLSGFDVKNASCTYSQSRTIVTSGAQEVLACAGKQGYGVVFIWKDKKDELHASMATVNDIIKGKEISSFRAIGVSDAFKWISAQKPGDDRYVKEGFSLDGEDLWSELGRFAVCVVASQQERKEDGTFTEPTFHHYHSWDAAIVFYMQSKKTRKKALFRVSVYPETMTVRTLKKVSSLSIRKRLTGVYVDDMLDRLFSVQNTLLEEAKADAVKNAQPARWSEERLEGEAKWKVVIMPDGILEELKAKWLSGKL